MIELKNISKTFYQKNREIKALSNVSLSVEQGKIFGVIGTSGAGKSTLIRCVNLLEKPTSGDVTVNGEVLTRLSSSQLAKQRRQIGMIFQHFNLLSSRTVFDNIAFPLELDGVPKIEIKERVLELLKLVGLDEKVNDYPANLSGGQKQRVAIARTLASNPKVLLCDEATSALDPATTRSILNLLKDINQRLGITILLITHEMAVVKSICDYVAIMSEGHIIEQGTVGEVFVHPKTELTRAYINSTLHIEIPDPYRKMLKNTEEGNQRTLLKLETTGNSIDEPLLSQAARIFQVDTKIISAQMDYAGNVSFGIILVELSGNPKDCQEAIKFFIEKQIIVEIIGYV